MEKEWKTIKDAIVGIADELCGKTSVKQNNTLDGRKNLEGNWRKERDMEDDRSENGQQTDTTLHQLTDRRRRWLGEPSTKQRGKWRRNYLKCWMKIAERS